MDPKGAAPAVPTRVYEDFVPTTELVQEQDSDTLLLNLTGFKKEQVRVQLTKSGILKISGQRPVGQNNWLRFQKDFPISENCDKNKISAKFENCILYVKQPKLITSAEKKDKELPTPDTQQPKKPADHAQQVHKKDEEQVKSQELPTPDTQQPKKPADHEQQAQKKDDEQPKSQELPKQANADNAAAKEPEKEEPKITSPETNEQTTEAKDLPEKTPAEKSKNVEDENKPSYDTKHENDAKMGTGVALAEKLKMPRKVMNMTLIALLVLGIGLYISNMMKSNNYQAEK
ncbi:inactive protein RESTRICTED TEV MOVEMENT 2-like isoform X1 [Nicotiana tomentosiformis]|uniref:inactive protein RESTRICTED TEV MOVEMENT 2-like isoform X1 n=1 Tax=Nicotiana tomentosiformis TaxID=4098 RepID=UPI00051C05E0|nr:inactive protein RESTRICTED TEV MOVEMENT 2-like [Nicotiana tomentosiformis]